MKVLLSYVLLFVYLITISSLSSCSKKSTSKPQTLTLQPTTNPTESYAYSYVPSLNTINTTALAIFAWTVSGTPTAARSYVKFDFSQIPTNATVDSAHLSLYSLTQAEFTSLTGAVYAQFDVPHLQDRICCSLR